MEAASIPETPAARAAPARRDRPSADNILWVLLGAGARRTTSSRTPSRRSTTSRPGLSNGTIWALIALGYTLVYGIIELINFAHGEVFMIGSFVSVSIWQTLGRHARQPSLVAILGSIARRPRRWRCWLAARST